MPNRLINETSPYLLQHAHNPVDWYAWGAEALRRARAEDKPILLSVGYSACHWCHVMERESFEDAATAALMNTHFICIKVDREERPDIDSIYMAAVQAMTRHGGWPMTVFLTPDGAPFYGGTYYPPAPRHGLPSFTQLLESVAEAYTTRRQEVEHSSASLSAHLISLMQLQIPQLSLSPALFRQAVQTLMQGFDAQFGGYGRAPKFPQAMTLEAVLRYWRRTDDAAALHQVEHTLKAMASGGMYDQLGGGFARYSVDAYWLVPHFEKMLYDNALLARVYLDAFQATANPFYARIASETLDYLLRDMRSAEGGFYAAEDADSEGEEGKFYVWTPDELRAALSADDAELAMRFWDVSAQGNFEGHSILNVPTPLGEVARQLAVDPPALWERLTTIRATLLKQRSQRIRPSRDEKILAAWNGLALRAFAQAAQVLERTDYREAARACAEFICTMLLRDGRLLRSFKDGSARHQGYLEDYAWAADGLLALYETTLEPRWLEQAISLMDTVIAHFWDNEQRMFFDTADDHEALLLRPRDAYDSATPSGTSVTADVLLRLGLLLERVDYTQYGQAILDELSGGISQMPGGFGRLLAALDFATGAPFEVAVMGQPGAADTAALLHAAWQPYVPNKVVAGAASDDLAAAALIPLLAERPLHNGQATGYVCVNRACKEPTTDPAVLLAQLEAANAA